MAVTETTRIARKLAGRRTTIFNDKLADGRRSLKVWGWDRFNYEICKECLEKAGHTVELVEFDTPLTYWRKAGSQIRLHVTEN